MLKTNIKKWTARLLSELLIQLIAASILYLLSAVGIFLLIKNKLQLQVPLWRVLLISLSILFGCLILFLIYSSRRFPKIKYLTVGDQKWKTIIFDSRHFEVEKNPICKEHNLPFISGSHNIHCPERRIKLKCKNFILHEDHDKTYEIAKSYIDKMIRERNY